MNIRKTIERLVEDNFYADTSVYVSKLNDDFKLEFISKNHSDELDDDYFKLVDDALDDNGIFITLVILDYYDGEDCEKITIGDDFNTWDFLLKSKTKNLLLTVPTDISYQLNDFIAYGIFISKTPEGLDIEFGMEDDEEFYPFIDDEIDIKYSIRNPINKYAYELMKNEIVYDLPGLKFNDDCF